MRERMPKEIHLSDSIENFLEIILELERRNKVARAKDIAERLGIQRGSVTGALKKLEEKKLINYQPYSFITLTEKGAQIAKAITRRHTVLKDFLSKVLQLEEETAESTACRMEHAIDDLGINRLDNFLEYFFQCPRTGEDWIQTFIENSQSGKRDWERCDQCLDNCKTRHKRNIF